MIPPIEKLGSPDQITFAKAEIGLPAFFELLPPIESSIVDPTSTVKAIFAAYGSQKYGTADFIPGNFNNSRSTYVESFIRSACSNITTGFPDGFISSWASKRPEGTE